MTEVAVPLFIAAQQTLRHLHSALFKEVLQERGVFPVAPLTPDEEQALQQRLEQQLGKKEAQRQAMLSVKGFATQSAQYTASHMLLPAVTAAIPGASLVVSLWGSEKVALPYMAPYLQMKGLTTRQQQRAVMQERKTQFAQFGLAAALLSSLPLLNIVLSFGTTAGAAMWAADMEKRHERLFKSVH
jgi:hypothetical protein